MTARKPPAQPVLTRREQRYLLLGLIGAVALVAIYLLARPALTRWAVQGTASSAIEALKAWAPPVGMQRTGDPEVSSDEAGNIRVRAIFKGSLVLTDGWVTDFCQKRQGPPTWVVERCTILPGDPTAFEAILLRERGAQQDILR